MPRSPGGVYSLIPGYLAVTGQTIQISQHNPVFEDVAAAMTNSLDRTGAGSMLAALNMGTYRITNLGTGVNPTDAATVAQVASATPVGIVADFAGATPPVGWLLCYGQAVSRTEYAALFAAIGTAWGAGDGTTTFNLPDCRGRIRAGKDNMGGTDAGRLSGLFGSLARTLAGFFGTASHTLVAGEMPTHTHAVSGTTSSAGTHSHSVSGSTSTDGTHAHDIPTRSSPGSATSNILGVSTGSPAGSTTGPAGAHAHTVSGSTDSAGAHTHTFSATSTSAGSGGAHNNTQPTVIFNTIIKAV